MTKPELTLNAVPTATNVGNAGETAAALAVSTLAKALKEQYGLPRIGWRSNPSSGWTSVGPNPTLAQAEIAFSYQRLQQRIDYVVANNDYLVLDFTINAPASPAFRALGGDWTSYNSSDIYTARPPAGPGNAVWNAVVEGQMVSVEYMAQYLEATYPGKKAEDYIRLGWVNEPRRVGPNSSNSATLTTLADAGTTGIALNTAGFAVGDSVTVQGSGTWTSHAITAITPGTPGTVTISPGVPSGVTWGVGTVVKVCDAQLADTGGTFVAAATAFAAKGSLALTLDSVSTLSGAASGGLLFWREAKSPSTWRWGWVSSINSLTVTLAAGSELAADVLPGTTIYGINCKTTSAGTDDAWFAISNHLVPRIRARFPKYKFYGHTFHGNVYNIAPMMFWNAKNAPNLYATLDGVRYNTYKFTDPCLPDVGYAQGRCPGVREYTRCAKKLHNEIANVLGSIPAYAGKPILNQEFGPCPNFGVKPFAIPFTTAEYGQYLRALLDAVMTLQNHASFGWFQQIAYNNTNSEVPTWDTSGNSPSLNNVGVISRTGNVFASAYPLLKGTSYDRGAAVPTGFANAAGTYVVATTEAPLVADLRTPSVGTSAPNV